MSSSETASRILLSVARENPKRLATAMNSSAPILGLPRPSILLTAFIPPRRASFCSSLCFAIPAHLQTIPSSQRSAR